MELRHLRYFVAVAEEENFHRAAERLHVAQSPLSRQIRQLEEEMGVDLFEPAGRGVRLTSAGHAFAERARDLLAGVELAVDEARDATEGRIGSVTIGFASGAAYVGALATIVARLRARQPRVKVSLRTMSVTDQWEALRVGEIALAYGNYVAEEPSLRSVVLTSTPIGMLVPRDHRLARRTSVHVKDLANEPILMSPRRFHARLYDDILAAVHARGVKLNVVSEIADREALWALVAAGLGVTFSGEKGARFLDPRVAADETESVHVAPVWKPLRGLGVEIRDVVTWRVDQARSPIVAQLIEIVDEVRRARVTGPR